MIMNIDKEILIINEKLDEIEKEIQELNTITARINDLSKHFYEVTERMAVEKAEKGE